MKYAPYDIVKRFYPYYLNRAITHVEARELIEDLTFIQGHDVPLKTLNFLRIQIDEVEQIDEVVQIEKIDKVEQIEQVEQINEAVQVGKVEQINEAVQIDEVEQVDQVEQIDKREK
jgi:hypothetical protein